MTEINSRFERVAITVKSLPSKPDNDTLSQLRALNKQGSCGGVSGKKPAYLDFVTMAEYQAWKNLKCLSQDNARRRHTEPGGQSRWCG